MSQLFLVVAICSLLIVIFLILKSVFHTVKPCLKKLIRFIQIRPYFKRICIISLICILSFIGFYATKEQAKNAGITLKEHGPGWNNSDEFNEAQK